MSDGFGDDGGVGAVLQAAPHNGATLASPPCPRSESGPRAGARRGGRGPNALAAGEDPSWVAATLGHTSPEMLFSVYARYIPNRTRRDGSALLSRMTDWKDSEATGHAGATVLPKYSR